MIPWEPGTGYKVLQGSGKVRGHVIPVCGGPLWQIMGTKYFPGPDVWEDSIIAMEHCSIYGSKLAGLHELRAFAAAGIFDKAKAVITGPLDDDSKDTMLVPYGYRLEFLGRTNKKNQPVRDLVIDEDESAVVKEIYRLITVEGYGTNRVASYLNKKGIKTKRGTTLWRGTSIRVIIGNPVYKGILRFGPERSEPFEKLRIVSDETFDRCLEIVKGRAPDAPKERVEPIQQGSRSMLTGLLYCGCCGNRLCYSHNTTHRKLADGTEKVTCFWGIWYYRQVMTEELSPKYAWRSACRIH